MGSQLYRYDHRLIRNLCLYLYNKSQLPSISVAKIYHSFQEGTDRGMTFNLENWKIIFHSLIKLSLKWDDNFQKRNPLHGHKHQCEWGIWHNCRTTGDNDKIRIIVKVYMVTRCCQIKKEKKKTPKFCWSNHHCQYLF